MFFFYFLFYLYICLLYIFSISLYFYISIFYLYICCFEKGRNLIRLNFSQVKCVSMAVLSSIKASCSRLDTVGLRRVSQIVFRGTLVLRKRTRNTTVCKYVKMTFHNLHTYFKNFTFLFYIYCSLKNTKLFYRKLINKG